jgi:hypothetical protein
LDLEKFIVIGKPSSNEDDVILVIGIQDEKIEKSRGNCLLLLYPIPRSKKKVLRGSANPMVKSDLGLQDTSHFWQCDKCEKSNHFEF